MFQNNLSGLPRKNPLSRAKAASAYLRGEPKALRKIHQKLCKTRTDLNKPPHYSGYNCQIAIVLIALPHSTKTATSCRILQPESHWRKDFIPPPPTTTPTSCCWRCKGPRESKRGPRVVFDLFQENSLSDFEELLQLNWTDTSIFW